MKNCGEGENIRENGVEGIFVLIIISKFKCPNYHNCISLIIMILSPLNANRIKKKII